VANHHQDAEEVTNENDEIFHGPTIDALPRKLLFAVIEGWLCDLHPLANLCCGGALFSLPLSKANLRFRVSLPLHGIPFFPHVKSAREVASFADQILRGRPAKNLSRQVHVDRQSNAPAAQSNQPRM
jgi:hypothetical protein